MGYGETARQDGLGAALARARAAARSAGGEAYQAPAQTGGDFLAGRASAAGASSP